MSLYPDLFFIQYWFHHRDLEKKQSAATAAPETAKPTKAAEDAERRKRKLHNHRTRPSYFTAHQDKVCSSVLFKISYNLESTENFDENLLIMKVVIA